MKKLLFILVAVLITATMLAQSPQKMSYQAVIRDAGNKLITSHSVGMRVSILKGSASGAVVYSETQTPTTNANGLVNIEIGGGTGFDAINWASGTYFIKSETDPTGGTNYTINSTIQPLSVPYAWYAKTVHVTYRISSIGDTLSLGNGKRLLIPGISTANPNTSTYSLNVTATNGTVVKDPDLATYTNGTSVQLTATPNSGYTFTSWSGGASGSTNPLQVLMNANKNITANFTAVAANTFTLNVTATNGIVAKNPDLATYNSGATVQLTATPILGYRFTSWSGDVTSATNPLTVSMNANKTITANFVEGDTKTLQALIDQCPLNGTVTIPAGTYYINTQIALNLKSNMTLQMESGAILKAIPNNTANITNILKIEGKSNVKVFGGTLIGERTGHIGTTGEFGMAIGLYTAHDVAIEGVTAKDCWGDGIFVGYESTNVTISSVIADNNRRQGLSIVSVTGMVVQNSVFKNTGGTAPEAGIDIEPDKGGTVNNVQLQNNEFFGNAGAGIVVTYPNGGIVTDITISGNKVHDNAKGGIAIGVNGITVRGNTVYSNSGNGISGFGRSNNIVDNNNVYLNTVHGIVFANNSNNNTITGNTVKDNRHRGIVLYNETGSTYTGTTGNIVTGNTAKGNPDGNISDLVTPAGSNTISDNIVD